MLDEGQHWSVSGLCGRIWTLRATTRGSTARMPSARWDEPGTVRVLFAHWVERDGDGSPIVSEARVAPVDRRAALRLRSLWMSSASSSG